MVQGFAFVRNGAVWKFHDTLIAALRQAEEVKALDAETGHDRIISAHCCHYSEHQDAGPVTYVVEHHEWIGWRWRRTYQDVSITIGPPQKWR